MDLAMEDYRRALGRITVLLLALAGLAERAAGRSRPLRGFLIRLLCPAEAVARAFVVDAALVSGTLAPPLSPVFPGGGDGPAEAMRLASRLRALASALADLAARRGRWTCFDDEINLRFHSHRATLRQCRISSSCPKSEATVILGAIRSATTEESVVEAANLLQWMRLKRRARMPRPLVGPSPPNALPP